MVRGGGEWNVTELRGLACLLLVAYHVVGVPGAGMRVADGSAFRYLTDSIGFIRMPLFTFISGLVYAYRPAEGSALAAFYAKKLRRLLVPFLVVSTLFYSVQMLIPGTNRYATPEHLWEIYVYPYAHFWYLQALLLIFVLVGALDAARVLARSRSFAVLFAAAVAASLVTPEGDGLLGVGNAVGLLPYFLAGVAFTRFRGWFGNRAVGGVALAGLALAVALHQASLSGALPVTFGRTSPVALLCGLAGAIVLVRSMPRSGVLRLIGRSSYAVYLYHAFFTAAARLLLVRLGADDLAVFTIAVAAGVSGPMAVDMALAFRPRWMRTALVGRT